MPFPVDEKYIDIAEKELGVFFPVSFKEKMMRENGGAIDHKTDCFQIYPFFDTSDKKRLRRTCNSIVHETLKARKDYGLPKDLVAIGDNGSGDYLVFKITNHTLEQTVFWLDHETSQLYIVANNFSELCN